MKNKIILFVGLSIALGVGPTVRAQDPSLADTVYLSIENGEDTSGAADGDIVVDIFLSLNSANLIGAFIGITWDRHFDNPTPDGTVPISTSDWQYDSLVYQGSFTNPVFWLILPPVDSIADSLGAVAVGGVSFSSGIAPGSDQLVARLYLSLAPGNSWGPGSKVTIDSSFVPPSGDFLLAFPDGTYVVPTFLGEKVVTHSPGVCCATPGDYNDDGTFNIADVTAGVNRIFQTSAPAPPCQDQADSNGDSVFNITDVVYNIAVIFAAGPPPVCGATGS